MVARLFVRLRTFESVIASAPEVTYPHFSDIQIGSDSVVIAPERALEQIQRPFPESQESISPLRHATPLGWYVKY